MQLYRCHGPFPLSYSLESPPTTSYSSHGSSRGPASGPGLQTGKVLPAGEKPRTPQATAHSNRGQNQAICKWACYMCCCTFVTLPNLDKMSCCSSRLENRILGFSPLMLVFSHGWASWHDLSLGSTSTSRFTWNRSGYFS